MTPILEISSSIRPYAVFETASLRDAMQRAANGQRALCLVDSKVRAAYAVDFVDCAADVLEIEASESAKSFENLAPLITTLLERGFRRDWILIAVGGGVVQDIAAFVCSILFRGARWNLLPTTLLAQCDSCIGSKSSINIAHFKNQLGTFYPPENVFLTPTVLQTLPDADVLSGLGEIIKLHLIAGEKPFEELRAVLDAQPLRPSPEVLKNLTFAALNIKKPFIESDEMDRGVRNLLNYGHTFGHAFESATQYAVPHGIAVMFGVSAATHCSAQLGWVSPAYACELHQWLGRYWIDHAATLRAVEIERIFAAMKQDKKNRGDTITCILTRGAGRMEKHALETAQLQSIVQQWLSAL